MGDMLLNKHFDAFVCESMPNHEASPLDRRANQMVLNESENKPTPCLYRYALACIQAFWENSL